MRYQCTQYRHRSWNRWREVADTPPPRRGLPADLRPDAMIDKLYDPQACDEEQRLRIRRRTSWLRKLVQLCRTSVACVTRNIDILLSQHRNFHDSPVGEAERAESFFYRRMMMHSFCNTVASTPNAQRNSLRIMNGFGEPGRRLNGPRIHHPRTANFLI
jgi:hypothetical protein